MKFEDLPTRMTTREVAKFARLSAETVLRRMRSGKADLKPVDEGREYVFLARDVWRVFVPDEPASGMQPAPRKGGVDADEIMAVRKRKPGKAPLKGPAPTIDASEHRALMLRYKHKMTVARDPATGLYDVVFAPRKNMRSEQWPARIVLPQANPGPVSLDTVAEFDLLAAEADALTASCRAEKARPA